MATQPVQNLLPGTTGNNGAAMTESAVSTPQVASPKASVPVPAPAPNMSTNAGPVVAPPPSVITAAPAVADANSKIASVNNLASTMKVAPPSAPPGMVTIYNANGTSNQVPQIDLTYWQSNGWNTTRPATPATNATPAPAANATTGAGAGAATTAGATGAPAGPAGLTPLPNAPTAPDTTGDLKAAAATSDTATAANNAKSDAAFTQYQNTVNSMMNGTFQLPPDQQAQIDNITQQFQQTIDAQKVANQNYDAAVAQAGISAGRNMYAPEVELGNVNAAIAEGSRAVADIQTKMASAVFQATEAFKNDDFKMLDSLYTQIQNHISEQQKVIDDTYSKAKDALAASQQKFQDDMATANFNLDVAKTLNQPILDADKQLKDYLYSQAQKYSDAGITAADTVQSAVDKIKASQSYKDEQAKKAADLEATKANTAQSYAAAAASRASAAKSYADLGAADITAVQGWVTNIKSGTAHINDVPANLKNAVSTGLAATGNSVSDILTSTVSSLKELNDMVTNNQGFKGAVGSKLVPGTLFGIVPKGLPGSAQADFNAKLNQVKNDVVLPNLTILRGLGRITDREFQSLSSAVTSLSADTSEGAFIKELKNVTDTINTKIAEAQPSSSGNAKEGDTHDYNGVTYKLTNGNWVSQ